MTYIGSNVCRWYQITFYALKRSDTRNFLGQGRLLKTRTLQSICNLQHKKGRPRRVKFRIFFCLIFLKQHLRTYQDIRYLFQLVNHELENEHFKQTLAWYKKQNTHFSINRIKKKASLAKLMISNYEIKRAKQIKFLRVLFDENLSWKIHI